MTEAQPPRRVLLVGAHLDGRWVHANPRDFIYRVPKPRGLDLARWAEEADKVTTSLPEAVDYRIEKMPIAIGSARADIWIGVSTDLYGADRDLAIARAIFQRDIAEHFREQW